MAGLYKPMLVLVIEEYRIEHGHAEEESGVYGARTRNLRRDRAAL
jgi:hypothetical protein